MFDFNERLSSILEQAERMDRISEQRYGRLCSLVLNICPCALRRKIEILYKGQGIADFETFLETNKHSLFHLMYRKCCCTHVTTQKTKTPMNKCQWDSMFCIHPVVLQHDPRGVCPCTYYPKPGIAPGIMDVTLCYILLNNLFVLKITDDDRKCIETIRLVRNQLIHAGSASLDEPNFKDLWTKVETATLDLAKSISQAAFDEASDKIDELKCRIMDQSELIVLRQAILDQGTLEKLKEDIDDTKRRVTNLEQIRSLQTESFSDEKVYHLREILIMRNFEKTKCVPLSPLHTKGKKNQLEDVFVPVVIREESNSKEQGKQRQIENPQDLFYMNGKPVKKVFLQGEAGRGKSVYCQQLLRNWCKAKQVDANKELSAWEKCLDEFDFAFLITLRLVDRKRTNLLKMIYDDILTESNVCKEIVYHILSSLKYRCLIVVDGLDEWKISKKRREKLVHDFLPNVTNVSNCTLFYTFRPWLMAFMNDAINDTDKVVKIEGLDEKGREEVIGNVLEHHYGLNKTSLEFQDKKQEMIKLTKDENFKSLMDNPLIITSSVILWTEGEHVGNSMTSFYTALVQLLIKRAKHTRVLSDDTFEKVKTRGCSNLKLPKMFGLQHNATLKNFVGFLTKLGDMAYGDLMSDESHLVFGKEELDANLNASELDFALKTGLLSYSEASSVFDREFVSVRFFHSTIQEFIAAIHVVCDPNASIDSFWSNMKSTEMMLSLSNVLMFISGLSPLEGNILSGYISSAVSDDKEMVAYRKDFLSSDHKAEMIYNMQVDCYKELNSDQTLADESDHRLQYHVKDVHIATKNRIRSFYTADILIWHFGGIQSLFVKYDPWFLNERLKMRLYDAIQWCLLQSNSLEALALMGHPEKWSIKAINERLLLKTLSLHHVTVTPETINALQKSFQRSKRLCHLDILRLSIDSGESKRVMQNPSLVRFLQSLKMCDNLTTFNIDYKSLLSEDVKMMFLHILPELHKVESFFYTGAYYDYEDADDSMVKFKTFKGKLESSGEEIIQDLTPPSVTQCSKKEYEKIMSDQALETFKGDQRNEKPNVHITSRMKSKELTQKQINFDSRVVQKVACMKQLRMVKLFEINVDSRSFELSSEMKYIEKVMLRGAIMDNWNTFLLSLLDVHHEFEVVLECTDIDYNSVTLIDVSPHFITKPNQFGSVLGMKTLVEFTRIIRK